MADELENVELGGSHYPWADWTNGKAWVAREGEDFQVPARSFRAYLYEKANALGMGVVTKLVERGSECDVMFQFVSMDHLNDFVKTGGFDGN